MTIVAPITLRCRSCGWQFAHAGEVPNGAIDADGHIRQCPACPGVPCRDVLGCVKAHVSCTCCGQDVHSKYDSAVKSCLDCLASGKGRARCEWTYHSGNRMVSRSNIVRVTTESPIKKQRKEWYVCGLCYSKNRSTMKEWDETLLPNLRAVTVRDVTLQAKVDPYARHGGRGALWKPRAGQAGVGSYLLFLLLSHERIFVAGKYYWMVCGQIPTEFVPQGPRQPTIAYIPLVSLWAQPRDYVFVAVTGVQPNRFQYGKENNRQDSPHTHTIIVSRAIDGMLDDCLEAGLDIAKGARVLT